MRAHNRWVLLIIMWCVAVGTGAANDKNSTSPKKPVLSIDLGRITFNGKSFALPATTEEVWSVFGKPSRRTDTYDSMWDRLGIHCDSYQDPVTRRFLPEGISSCSIELMPNPNAAPLKPFSGVLLLDGAPILPETTIEAINRVKAGPQLRQSYVPYEFEYQVIPPEAIRNPDGTVSSKETTTVTVSPLRASGGIYSLTVDGPSSRWRPPPGSPSFVPHRPITRAEVKEVLKTVLDATREHYSHEKASRLVGTLAENAVIWREGVRETRDQFRASVEKFFYTVANYRYEQNVESLEIAPDGLTATIKLTVRERYSEEKGEKRNIEHVTKQHWLLERVYGQVVVTELRIE